MADEILSTLSSPCSRTLLGLNESHSRRRNGVARSLEELIKNSAELVSCSREAVEIANAALHAFLQATVTGPPLGWDVKTVVPCEALLPLPSGSDEEISHRLITFLSVDGEAVYQRLPYVELFVFAKILLDFIDLHRDVGLLRARLRVNSWHQRLLNQTSPTLEAKIYEDLGAVSDTIMSNKLGGNISYAEFLLEKAAIHLLHGYDTKASVALTEAAKDNSFEFVLTGRLGKRTKFQQKDISQLVILAKSAKDREIGDGDVHSAIESKSPASTLKDDVQPHALRLDDDTLLDSIAFTPSESKEIDSQKNEPLPPSLANLDPGNQPRLDPLDAIILLSTASSITNTSPSDGITREETLPFAERVISGGSSNWQIYTEALLIRSRIEGYRTRTIERGVLQLQALVDQVIAETSGHSSESTAEPSGPDGTMSTFLPRPKQSESASVTERLRYIHQLASPPRWKLESELADRWVSLGGLRTALEIYERLGMWAEAALCLAAEGKERKARRIIRGQLYQHPVIKSDLNASEGEGEEREDDLKDYNVERQPLPADAPRLFCILGDLEDSPAAYERAWVVSNSRFARAQRSLGKFYSSKNEMLKADEAYVKSLNANPQNHAIWFALGCVRLQTEDWSGAVEAFKRAVQIEDSDAESWSNLAVSLLRMPGDDTETQKNARSAFTATRKATSLKRENSKLWQNLLAIGVQLSPPPYAEIVMAQSRLIELLGKSQGESIVDAPIVEALLAHIIETHQPNAEEANTSAPLTGLRKLVIDLITKQITPLVTSSRPLWLIIAKLNIHLRRPLAALNTYEKAWRSALNQPGWESSKKQWKDVSDATIDLIDAYESLGERERESGLGEGELVAKDWKFKSRSAARSILSRAKEGWEGDEAYEVLQERLKELKS